MCHRGQKLVLFAYCPTAMTVPIRSRPRAIARTRAIRRTFTRRLNRLFRVAINRRPN